MSVTNALYKTIKYEKLECVSEGNWIVMCGLLNYFLAEKYRQNKEGVILKTKSVSSILVFCSVNLG